MTEEFAALYVVATLLGNLADLTRRDGGAMPSRRVLACGICQVGVVTWQVRGNDAPPLLIGLPVPRVDSRDLSAGKDASGGRGID